MARIVVHEADFDVGAEIAALTAGRTDIGGIGCFVGTVRDTAPGLPEVAALTLEHYPAMTHKALERIVAEAEQALHVRLPLPAPARVSAYVPRDVGCQGGVVSEFAGVWRTAYGGGRCHAQPHAISNRILALAGRLWRAAAAAAAGGGGQGGGEARLVKLLRKKPRTDADLPAPPPPLSPPQPSRDGATAAARHALLAAEARSRAALASTATGPR